MLIQKQRPPQAQVNGSFEIKLLWVIQGLLDRPLEKDDGLTSESRYLTGSVLGHTFNNIYVANITC